MPKATDVLCIHCQQYMSRSRERSHRKSHYAPTPSTPPRIPSKLHRVFDVSEDIAEIQETESNDAAAFDGTVLLTNAPCE